jgi:4-aminobutyrate aminotransferase
VGGIGSKYCWLDADGVGSVSRLSKGRQDSATWTGTSPRAGGVQQRNCSAMAFLFIVLPTTARIVAMEKQANAGRPDSVEGDLNFSPNRRAWQQSAISEKTRAWLEKDEQFFLRQSLSTPCLNVLVKAEGIWLEDIEGRRYMDFHGNDVHQVGFANPHVLAAVQRQMEILPFCTRRYTNIPAIQLAEKLAALAPGDLSKVLFVPGGTTAIGIAMKLARVATGRFKTISMWDSFHGASLDAISVGGERLFRSGIGPLLPGTEHVPPPDAARCVFGCNGTCTLRCANYIEYVLEREGDIGAVIAETVRNTGVIPPPDYWKRVRSACDRHGALLILDEIHSLGRTGSMFSCEQYGIVPDILVLGKSLGGALFPLAAVVARSHLDVGAQVALGHYTHEKNPVACAAALATLEYIESEHLIERSRSLGAWTLARLREMQRRQPHMGDVRGLGLLLNVEIVMDQTSRTPAADLADRVMYEALSRGLRFKVTMGNVVSLAPPLIITDEQMSRALEILEQSIEAAARS